MKPFKWEKHGLIYCLDDQISWAKDYTQMPTVDAMCDRGIDIFFSSRDQINRSLIGRLTVNRDNPKRIVNVQQSPVLELGDLGTFDDCGVMPSSLVNFEGRKYLYYIGWNVRNTVPYHNSVGLAVSEDKGLTYQKIFTGPIMDRTHDEPYFCATTCVIVDNGIWRNWYLSCTGWFMVSGKPEPRYHLKYAESSDGINWKRSGTIAIDYVDQNEGGIARATVIKDGSLYRMWYSYRSILNYRSDSHSSYRIGYAESSDGISWKRLDDRAGIDVSGQGWDAFMLAYPEVVDIDGRKFMFYNGNGFGKSGIGYAELLAD